MKKRKFTKSENLPERVDNYLKIAKNLVRSGGNSSFLQKMNTNKLPIILPCLILGGTEMNLSAATFSRNINVTIAEGATGNALRIDVDGNVGGVGGAGNGTTDFDFKFNFAAPNSLRIQEDDPFNQNHSRSGYGNNSYVRKLGYSAVVGGNLQNANNANPMTFTSGTANSLWRADGVGFLGIKFNIAGTDYTGWIALEIQDKIDGGGTREIQVISAKWTDGGTISTPAPGNLLPVELTKFAAKNTNSQIALHWQTATETNNAGFEVQRSMDGKTFQNLTFIEGNGTTHEQQDYVYDDKDLRQGQTYYYRLKQIDFDDGFEYSEVITARTAGQEVTGVFAPNPAVAGQTVLSYSTPAAGKMVLRVFDVAGKELLRQTNAVVEGSNRYDLDFSDLGTGLFFVKMEQGGQTAYEKVVVE